MWEERQWLLGYPLLPPGEDQLTHGLYPGGFNTCESILSAAMRDAIRYKYVAGMQALVARELLSLSSDDGGTVLDPFCGSGTVLIESRPSRSLGGGWKRAASGFS